jgi:hypothetical protein
VDRPAAHAAAEHHVGLLLMNELRDLADLMPA